MTQNTLGLAARHRPLRGPAHRALLRRRLSLFSTVILFLLPTIAGVIVFQYIPLVLAARHGFYQVNLLSPNSGVFKGLDNYLIMTRDPKLLRAFGNTLLYIFGKLFIQIPLALLLAIAVNRQMAGVTVLRTALFAPIVTSAAIIALVWNLLYFPGNGLFNAILHAVGLPTQPFLVSSHQALPSILTISIWQDVGFTMLLFLGALQRVPVEFYEAASIDGAGRVAMLLRITVPLLRRTVLLAAFMTTSAAVTIFAPIWVLTKGGPNDSTINAVYYIYEQGFQYLKMGYASTVAMVLIVFLTSLTLIQGRLLRTQFEY